MFITNWLAKADDGRGLVTPGELAKGNVRIYGNVYGNPNFRDGEYVQTAIIACCDGTVVTTVHSEVYTLDKQNTIYKVFLESQNAGRLVVKKWRVDNGILLGETLDGVQVAGKVVAQNFSENICIFEDGRRIFVDWLSKEPNYFPERGPEEFLTFATERCMPDIFCKHNTMFRKRNNEGCR